MINTDSEVERLRKVGKLRGREGKMKRGREAQGSREVERKGRKDEERERSIGR